jgi:hypothetical protein
MGCNRRVQKNGVYFFVSRSYSCNVDVRQSGILKSTLSGAVQCQLMAPTS